MSVFADKKQRELPTRLPIRVKTQSQTALKLAQPTGLVNLRATQKLPTELPPGGGGGCVMRYEMYHCDGDQPVRILTLFWSNITIVFNTGMEYIIWQSLLRVDPGSWRLTPIYTTIHWSCS